MNNIQQLYLKYGLTETTINSFRKLIYSYYKKNGRMFSWRETDDPYHIFVSEIMLQQTQTSRVSTKFDAFIAEFPDFKTLAQAPLIQVLKMWQGLGYNRRAIALKKTAEIVTNELDGKLPDSKEKLKKLPGIGNYTAAAIIAFAFNKPAIVLDTNIRTVYIHFFFDGKDTITDRELEPLIEATMDKTNPRQWYYALFDYGVMLKKTESNNNKSAHYHKQSSFSGSNREVRGKILTLITAKQSIAEKELITLLGIEKNNVTKNIEQLQKEGFIIREKGRIYIS